MNARWLLTCWIVLGGGMSIAGAPSRSSSSTADPNDIGKTRSIVSREEREAIGLKTHTWAGIVDPEVYAALDRVKKTVADMRDRLDEGKDEQAFDLLRKIRFEDTVYVQVCLKDQKASRRVLASLKASEFHVSFVFENSAGFIGYVSKEGAEKLGRDSEVLGVCLDDQPLAQRGRVITNSDLPPEKTGNPASTQPGVAEGKVDPDVYRAFDLMDRVYVTMQLRVDSLPSLTSREQVLQRERILRQIRHRILSSGITADEFWLSARSGLTPALSGYITRAGLQKVLKEGDVNRVYLEQRHHTN